MEKELKMLKAHLDAAKKHLAHAQHHSRSVPAPMPPRPARTRFTRPAPAHPMYPERRYAYPTTALHAHRSAGKITRDCALAAPQVYQMFYDAFLAYAENRVESIPYDDFREFVVSVHAAEEAVHPGLVQDLLAKFNRPELRKQIVADVLLAYIDTFDLACARPGLVDGRFAPIRFASAPDQTSHDTHTTSHTHAPHSIKSRGNVRNTGKGKDRTSTEDSQPS
ncbi:MAG: hypothetical protein S4CHLAM102_11850 [Chlamydiia bacterium]|nr:hypothetical protein [Chlamydiia bacterium]